MTSKVTPEQQVLAGLGVSEEDLVDTSKTLHTMDRQDLDALDAAEGQQRWSRPKRLPVITFAREAGFVLIRPKRYLGGDLFNVFRKAIEGATYDPKRKLNYATLDKLATILANVRAAEMHVEVDPLLVSYLAEQETKQWLDLQGAKERVEKLDEYMRTLRDAITDRSLYVFPYQKTGIPWLALKHGALLADEQGLGKTLQALGALPPSPAVLVVCPAAAKGVWRRQVQQFRPHLRVSVLKGRQSFRWPEPGEVVVVNYDILPEVHTKDCLARRKDKKTLVEGEHLFACLKAKKRAVPGLVEIAQESSVRKALQCRGCMTVAHQARECPGCLPILASCPKNIVLVYDEAHRLKNPKSQRSIKGKALSRTVRAREGRTWLVTGTPIVNKPEELWTLADIAFVAEEAFGSFANFVQLFNGRPADHGGWYWGDPETAEVAECLERIMLRRRKVDVMQELPKRTYQLVPVEIDEEVIRACTVALKAYGGIEKLLGNLEKVDEAGGKIQFGTMSSVRAALAAAKIPAMLEIVEEMEEAEEPLVVFSAHRAPIDVLAEREGWGVITGDTKDKAAVEEAFQRGELRGVGCTIKAGGESITLTRSCNLLRVDSEWSPSANQQADDRVHRLSQTRPVLVRILVADHPIDERVAEVLARKQHLIEQSVDAAAQKPESPQAGQAAPAVRQ